MWEVCRILTAHGLSKVWHRGSHIAMQKAGPDETVAVPVPDHWELRIGMLLLIIRQSEVPRTELGLQNWLRKARRSQQYLES